VTFIKKAMKSIEKLHRFVKFEYHGFGSLKLHLRFLEWFSVVTFEEESSSLILGLEVCLKSVSLYDVEPFAYIELERKEYLALRI
jgi:hypothetical protein